MTGSQRRWRTAVAAFTVAFVLTELLRVWLPALTTPARAGWFGVELVAAALVTLLVIAAAAVPSRFSTRTWTVAVASVAGLRLVLPLLGGPGLLIVSTLGVAAGFVAVVGLAGATADAGGRAARLGVLAGVAGATAVHAATRTAGLVWPRTAITLGLGLLVGVAVLLAGLRAREVFMAPTDGRGRHAAPWAMLTAVLLLPIAVTGAPGRVAMALGSAPVATAAIVTAVQGLGVVAAAVAPRLGTVRAAMGGAMLLLVGAAGAYPTSEWRSVVAITAASVGLGLAFGAPTGLRDHDDRLHRRVAGGAAAAFVVLVGTAAALMDASIIGADHLVPLTGALLAGVGAGVMCRPAGSGQQPRQVGRLPGWSVAAVVAVTASAAIAATSAPSMADTTSGPLGVWLPVSLLLDEAPQLPAAEQDGAGPAGLAGPADAGAASVLRDLSDTGVNVATYGVTAGFGLDRRFAPPRQARVLATISPDIAVLTGVDRGSLLTGGHDTLGLFAAELELGSRFFAPNSGARGNVLLTRFPVSDFTSRSLPRSPLTPRDGEFTAVLELPGHHLAVVGTQLTPASPTERLAQARAVAASVAQLRERGLPTAVIGELNAAPEDPELATFGSLLRDPLGPSLATSPSDLPEHRLHYVLLSPELRGGVVQRPHSEAAGHLPMGLTVTFVGAQR